MPTSHPRHAITETDEIADALRVARHAWPELADKPGSLLRRLILEGRNTLVGNASEATEMSRQGITETSGTLTGVFGANYLDRLREDWPE